MKTVNICKCNNCDNLFIDTNPQINARDYEIEDNSMEELINNYCPFCKVDDYLADVEEDIVLDYHHTIESIEIWKYRQV